MLQLLALPSKILADIFSRIEGRDLIVCARVSRSLRDLVQETRSLLYTHLLYRNGMVDNPRSAIGLPERLANLKEYEERWRALRWSACTEVTVNEREHQWQQTVVMDSHPGLPNEDRRLPAPRRLFRIPSHTRGVAEQRWTYELPMPVSSFIFATVDPSQDLLVALEVLHWVNRTESVNGRVQLHFYQLSAEQHHPEAAQNYIEFDYNIDLEDYYEGDWLHVYSSYFLIQGGSGLTFRGALGNWKEGEVPISLPVTMENCVLLDDGILAAMSKNYPAPSITLYQRPTPKEEIQGLVCILDLTLPPLDWENSLKGGYHDLRISRSAGAPFNPMFPTGNFCSMGDATLIFVEIPFSDPAQQNRLIKPGVEIRVSSRALFSFLPTYAKTARTTPWENWGPSQACVFECVGSARHAHNAHGLRASAPTSLDAQINSPTTLEVHDYHPGRVATALALEAHIPEHERNWSVRVGGKLTRFLKSNADSIETHLRYIVSRRQTFPADRHGEWQSITILEDSILTHTLFDPRDLRIFSV